MALLESAGINLLGINSKVHPDDKNKISIQHLLVVGKPSNQFIVKHWRQDWIYENRDFYMYNGDNLWEYENKTPNSVKKQWTQKVFQVDDSPRYEGSGSWVHVDGKSYWENKTDAPLPRREYTKRNDYNITSRGNRQEITSYGWVHDQDNDKVIREKDKEDQIIAQEFKDFQADQTINEQLKIAATELKNPSIQQLLHHNLAFSILAPRGLFHQAYGSSLRRHKLLYHVCEQKLYDDLLYQLQYNERQS